MPCWPTRIRSLLAGVLLLAPMPAHAQPAGADLHYRVWTTEEGLPQGSVRAIAQTADGYLWLATLDGLVRFDGVRMTVVTNADVPQLPSNRLTALLVDRDDALWIGTEDGGIVRRSGSTYRTFGRTSGLPPGPVFALVAERDERIWALVGSTWLVLDGERWVPREVPRGLPGVGAPPPDIAAPADCCTGSRAAGGRRSRAPCRPSSCPRRRCSSRIAKASSRQVKRFAPRLLPVRSFRSSRSHSRVVG